MAKQMRRREGASSLQAYMANGYNATKAVVTLATRACTPKYTRAVTPVTLSEYRYRRMSPTHRPPWRTACTRGHVSNSAGFLDGEKR